MKKESIQKLKTIIESMVDKKLNEEPKIMYPRFDIKISINSDMSEAAIKAGIPNNKLGEFFTFLFQCQIEQSYTPAAWVENFIHTYMDDINDELGLDLRRSVV